MNKDNAVNSHQSFAQAYIDGLAKLLAQGRPAPSVTDRFSIASNFGKGDRPAIELLGHVYELRQSEPCLFNSPLHRLNIPYAFGLFLWAIGGSDSVEWLSYYHERAADFSEDKQHLCGAFGKRLFDYKGSIDQIEIVLARLNSDPGSRRAIGLILAPEDNDHSDLDFPCAIGTQYFLRDGALHALVYMRAQQALTILPYDQFMFSSLQSLVAARLGVGAGRYLHFAGTFHIYQNEVDRARALVDAGPPPTVALGAIPPGAAPLAEVVALERALRGAAIAGDCDALRHHAQTRYAAGSFNEHARVVLTAHAFAKAGENPLPLIRDAELAPAVRDLLERQWGYE